MSVLGSMEKYIKEIKISEKEIKLLLNNEGLKYGETKEGARNLSFYITEKYQESQCKKFPRPIADRWNSVSSEIRDHCRWALGKGWGNIPLVKKRANPIDIRINDIPPFWH